MNESPEIIAPNPFAASEEEIALLRPEVIIRRKGFSLRAFTTKRSKGERVVQRFSGVHHLESEGALYLPTHHVVELLKTLRSRRIPFAVEQFTGELLASTADVRARILSGSMRGTADELRKTFLVPFIDRESDGTFSLSCVTAEQLRECFPSLHSLGERKIAGEQLDTDSVAELLERPLSFRLWITTAAYRAIPKFIEEERRAALRRRIEEFRAMRDVEPETALDSPTTARLFPHQRTALRWLRETPRAYLGDDMGLGKTLTVLTYFESLRVEGECDFLLVCCPNSLTRNWEREFQQWFPERKVSILPEAKSEKIAFLKRLNWGAVSLDALIVNYESVRLEYVFPQVRAHLVSSKPLLCLDESQRVKNHASKTFKALVQLVPLCRRRVLLSGTPTPRDIADIWSQVRLLDDGERFGRSFYRWLREVAELGTKYSEYAVKRYIPERVNESILRVQELLLRRRKDEVLSLPEKTFQVRDVLLTGDQRKRYDEVRRELLLQISSTSGETFTREIQGILEEYLRAVQIASNPRLVDESWKGEPAKFLELDEIIHDVVSEREEKIVVWTNYLRNVEELVRRYGELGVRPFSGEISTAERNRTLREFQQGPDIRILVAVPAAGGVGITLTAAQTAVYVDKTWNGEHWMQSVDRIHRIGQQGTVNIISLHACKVDELIAASLRRKESEQRKLLGDRAEVGRALPRRIPTREQLLRALRVC